MASYSLAFKKSVAKDLRSIPSKDVHRILKRINTLCENPRAEGCVKLSNQEKYRVRQGVYRIVYEIQDYELITLALLGNMARAIVFTKRRGQVIRE